MALDSISDPTHIAQAFVAARREGRALPKFPGTMPTALDSAYVVQDAAIELAGDRVVGWKVGRINPPLDGVDRLAGPIFSGAVFDAAADPLPMPVFRGGFAAAEAEFLLRVGTAPDPAKTSYTMEEARALIDAVHVGIEIASSPFPGINDNGAPVTVADFGNNNGLIVGDEAEGWRDRDIRTWPITLDINGERIGSATAEAMLDGPFGAARFLLENLASRGIAVAAGTWISTGAVTGVHQVAIGDSVVARFDDRFSVECTIAAQ